MRKKQYAWLTAVAVALALPIIPAIQQHSATACVAQAETPVLRALQREAKRTIEGLKGEEYPPYFVAYSVTEVQSVTIRASFGALIIDEAEHYRTLDMDVRVGNYDIDNTRQIRGANFEMGAYSPSVELPLSDTDTNAVALAVWEATDRNYKNAVERYLKVLSNRAVKVKEDDASADLAPAKPSVYSEPVKSITLNRAQWAERLTKISAIFKNDPLLFAGDISLRAEVWTRYIVNSEGTAIQTSDVYYRIFSTAKAKAEDGMSLPLYKSYFAYSPDRLPSEETLRNDAMRLVDLCGKLRKAPLIETYSGPAILSGEASGVFFHEIFGHRIEGHRQKDVNSSQTFKNLVNEKILPDFIDVVFDPRKTSLAGADISGAYRYDDEGVPGMPVTTVENGVFKNFLMSRAPIDGFPTSNGHGRKQPGNSVVSRQSNLIVQAKKTVPLDSLRKLLIEECKKQDKPFGLFFAEIEGGFTFTQRTIPNAFNVMPLLVYKIYTDGRPDEIVRGVDLIGTPLTTFKLITAAADDIGIFNGVCGAESGWVPVSASSPTLLVSNIEVQKKAKSQAQLPLLPPPTQSDKP